MQVDCFFDGDVAVIYLQDQFDLRESKGFRGAIDAIVDDANVREIEVNLSRFEHMDSSTLAFLLILRERAREGSKAVVLSGVAGKVQEVLKTASFEQIFVFRNRL
jgi:anti-anti-sigma factor